MESNSSNILNLILQQFSKQGWKNNNFRIDIYPYDNKSSIKYRHVIFDFKKNYNKTFSSSISIETFEYCILTVEESEQKIDKKDDDFIKFTFCTKPVKYFKKCVEKTLECFNEIKVCESCNRIFHKSELDNNKTCLTCNVQYSFEIRKEEGCSICLDSSSIKLMHRLPCEHEFHFSCLTKLTKKECPLCRACFALRRK